MGKRWNEQNPERMREIRRAWQEKNKPRKRPFVLRPPNWMSMTAAERRAHWWEQNKHKRCEYSAKRRALSNPPTWANRFFIEEIYDLARLRTKITGMPWEVDHIVPLVSRVVCGLHVENNLRVVQKSVNRRKNNNLEMTADAG